jgi:hypothetical protein
VPESGGRVVNGKGEPKAIIITVYRAARSAGRKQEDAADSVLCISHISLFEKRLNDGPIAEK